MATALNLNQFFEKKNKTIQNQMEIFAPSISELKFSEKIIEEMKRSIGIQAPFCEAMHAIYYVIK